MNVTVISSRSLKGVTLRTIKLQPSKVTMMFEAQVESQSEVCKKPGMSSLHMGEKTATWEDLHAEYRELERKINKACDQMTAIYSKIQAIQVRLDRARRKDQFGFTYTLEMQLQVLQGVYDKYHMYCSIQAERLLQVESLLFAGEE